MPNDQPGKEENLERLRKLTRDSEFLDYPSLMSMMGYPMTEAEIRLYQLQKSTEITSIEDAVRLFGEDAIIRLINDNRSDL